MNLQEALALANEAARQAGARLRELARGPIEVLSADRKDIKLAADREAEAIIFKALRENSPYPMLGEESGEQGDVARGPFWVVDPLDGTLNFSRGLPISAVAIALVESERALAGIIYDFNNEEMFSAALGAGAWLNGAPIHVSDRRDPGQSILATGFPSHHALDDASMLAFVRQVQWFKKLRLIGSAALSMAWVACGRVDAYAEDDIMLWDIAAGMVLVEEAGGNVRLDLSPRLKWGRRVRAAAHIDLWKTE